MARLDWLALLGWPSTCDPQKSGTFAPLPENLFPEYVYFLGGFDPEPNSAVATADYRHHDRFADQDSLPGFSREYQHGQSSFLPCQVARFE